MTQQTQQTQALGPVVTRSGEGEALWWFDSLSVVKATAEQTNGLLTVIEVTEPANAAGPLHVHHREDEAFWIVDGEMTLEVGDTVSRLRAGDFAFAPRDIPHRYTVGPGGCRMLYIMTPGGFENLVRGMSIPAEAMTLPPAPGEEPDWEHVATVAKANGCELLA